MSNAIFPAFPLLNWERTRSPQINSLLQKSVSGMQAAVQLQAYPIYTWKLSYDALRSDVAFLEYQTLLGFWNQMGGCVDTWLFNNWEDNAVAGQALGLGDGATKSFQLYRTLGGFTEPVLAANVLTAVYFNGAPQTIGAPPAWSVSNGVLTFTTAPGAGITVSADFSFYWRCRFTADTVDIDTLWHKYWALKKIEFNSVLLGSG